MTAQQNQIQLGPDAVQLTSMLKEMLGLCSAHHDNRVSQPLHQ